MALFAARRPAPVDRIPPTMGTRLFNASPENPTTSLSNPASWLYEALGGSRTFAGPHVNETSAMRSTAVFRCVALKAGVMAALPLKVYEHTDKGREEAIDHRLYPLLARNPNDLMSGYIWKELLFSTLMMRGNHYSIIEYDNAARVTGLLPALGPVRVERVDGRNRYIFTLKDGTEILDQEDVIHVPGLGFDGLTGLSPIGWAGRQAIGISLALEEFTGSIHANGARPSGVLSLGKDIKGEGVKRLRAEIEQMNGGSRNAGRILLADNGSEWHPMTLSLEDAQTLESRRFQIADICRLFGVPPFLVGETDKVSSWGTGIEQMVNGFKIFGLNPDLERTEGELNRKLFKWPFYCEFNRDALNAMDAKTLMELYASGIQNAGYTPNELRRMRNLPDKPGGDDLFIQSATVPIGKAGQAPASPAKPPA